MNKFIRTSKHTLKFSNKAKLAELNSFIKEYKRVAKLYLDYLWEEDFSHSLVKNNNITTTHFDANTKLDLPTMLSTVKINKELNLNTTLTGRAQKCCITQVLGIVRGDVEKQKKRQFIVNKLRSQSRKVSKGLRKKLRVNKPTKPNLDNMKLELNSVCIDFQEEKNKEFNAFLQLKSFTTDSRGKTINFPIRYHRTSNKWKEQGKQLNSYLLTNKNIQIRYEIEQSIIKKQENKVGADQGKLTVLTLSDSQATPTIDKHEHSLTSIIDKIERKKKGSKAFRQATDHRTNFINWSVNQLDFSNITTVGFERVINLKHGKRLPRHLTHWTYTDIKNKLTRKCEEKEVLLLSQSSTYRSQRCSRCGLVRKANRKGKVYICNNCGLEIDADLNASLNHQQDLPDVPYNLRRLNLNRGRGFFWKSTGFYDSLTGEELTVPLPKKVG